jgi:hypothetical protein
MRAQLAAPRFGQAPLDQSPVPVAAAASLHRDQIVRLAALAIVLWYAAALCIRVGLPAGLYGGSAGALLFVATGGLAWPTVRLAARVGALRPFQVVPGVAMACAVAMLCEGIALTWAPAVYGGVSPRLALGAAWLLWGVGAILLAAATTGRRRHPVPA